MGAETQIAWANHTFNIVWGCTKVSPGCQNCYAEALARRRGCDVWGAGKRRRTFGDQHWSEPLAWNRKALREGVRPRVFCGSMCDWCEDHPDVAAARARLWPLIRATLGLDWLLLTKRAERIAECLPADWHPASYDNVWLGVTIERGEYAYRADHLRRIPAVVRFVSYEPALGPMDALNLDGLDWIVYGGESGPDYREHDPQWARDLLTRVRRYRLGRPYGSGPAFFYKQSSGHRSGMGEELAGELIREYPVPRILRKAPTGATRQTELFG